MRRNNVTSRGRALLCGIDRARFANSFDQTEGRVTGASMNFAFLLFVLGFHR
jgi:hypothetical protein